MSAVPAESFGVTASLDFVTDSSRSLRAYAHEPPAGEQKLNAEFASHRVSIGNMRTANEVFTLDRQGFALQSHKSAVLDPHDADEVKHTYYPELEALIARQSGARRVVVFDHTLRERSPSSRSRAPVTRVHTDYTVSSGPERVRQLMGAEADALLRRRFAIVNVWRPIRGPLRDLPLALADASRVRLDELIPAALIYPDRVGSIYYGRFSPLQRWYYAPDMTRDEALLFKSYDSDESAPARFVPHAAFEDPTPWTLIEPRASIEARALAFF